MPRAHVASIIAAPSADTPLTPAQICQMRPALVPKTLRHWADLGLIPYTKRGPGKTAARLYRLADVDALLASFHVTATTGPLAGAR